MKYPLTTFGAFALTLQQLFSEGISITLNPLFCSSSSSSGSSDWCRGSSGHLTTHKKPNCCIRRNTNNRKLSIGYKLWQRRAGKRDWRGGADRDEGYGYRDNEQDEEYYVDDGPHYPPRGKGAQSPNWFGKFHDERQRHCESQDHHADDDVDPWLSAAFASESKSRDLPNSHLRHTSRDFAVDNTQDIVSEYESSSVMHRATIIASSAFVGSLAGAVLGEALFSRIQVFALIGLLVGILASLSKSIFGDMFRALGLGGVFTLQRCGQLCVLYPMYPYIRALVGLGPRIPFPPGPDPPWKYRGIRNHNPGGSLLFLSGLGGYAFSKMTSLHLPPSIMVLSIGGGSLWAATLERRLGDLLRLIGMRLVGLVSVLAEVNSEVFATAKMVAAFRTLAQALLFWDQKFELTDKLMAVVSHLIRHLTSAITALMAESEANNDDNAVEETNNPYDGNEQHYDGDFEGYYR